MRERARKKQAGSAPVQVPIPPEGMTMAILTKGQIKGGHWYTADGTPMHKMRTADGSGERATTIKDARRLGLYPSVTSIIDIFSKPNLDAWKLNQVALAALRNPKTQNEGDDYWCKRVVEASKEKTEQAADLGTRIHAALDAAMIGEAYDPEMAPYVEPVVKWKRETGILIVEREIRLVNTAHGFAGTSDVMFRYGENGIGILDYKTRKTDPGKPVFAYDGQAMQLAAYAATYWGEENVGRVLAANVFISTTESGRVVIVKHEKPAEDWEAFKHAAAIWRYQKGYDPRKVSRQEPEGRSQ